MDGCSRNAEEQKTGPHENGMLDVFLAYFAEAYDEASKKGWSPASPSAAGYRFPTDTGSRRVARSPSPMKLKARMTRGDHRDHREQQPRIEGDDADVLRASTSRMPQLVIGGLKPRPRKESAVSPRIMPGMAIVAEAIRCDMKPGRDAGR